MNEAEIVGTVLIALGTIIGVFSAIAGVLAKIFIKPMNDLKDSLHENTLQSTELSGQIKNLSNTYDRHQIEFDKQVQHNSEAHKRIWERVEEHDDKIDNHEFRLNKLEGK